MRTALAVGAVSLGLLAVSGCEQPTPLVTATVGGTSVSGEAACYNDGKTLKQSELKKCAAEKATQTVELGPGDKLRLGVEPDTARTGWMVIADGQAALPEPIKKTYYSFPGETIFQQQSRQNPGQAQTKKSAKVTVLETAGNSVKGVWHLKLKNDG